MDARRRLSAGFGFDNCEPGLGHADCDSDGHTEGNRYADPDSDRDTDDNRRADSYSLKNAIAHSDRDGDSDSGTYGNPNPGTDGN